MALHLRVVAERGVVDRIGDLAEEPERSPGARVLRRARREPSRPVAVSAADSQKVGNTKGAQGSSMRVRLTLVPIDETAAVESLDDEVEGRAHARADGVESAEECGLRERGVGTAAVEAELQSGAGRAELGADRGRGLSPCVGVAGDQLRSTSAAAPCETAHRGDQRVRVATRRAADLPDPVVGLAPVVDVSHSARIGTAAASSSGSA